MNCTPDGLFLKEQGRQGIFSELRALLLYTSIKYFKGQQGNDQGQGGGHLLPLPP